MSSSGVFAEIRSKHQQKLQERLVALPEAEQEAARQQFTAEAPLH